jgi:molybdopterin-containing oxidoreductase family membrane subunit
VAASAVMVVLPYYLHDYKNFGKITILGEFLAVPVVLMCMLFIFVDMGQPLRVLNVPLHPTLNSPMFWDFVVLSGYLLLNIVIGWTTLDAERNAVPPPKWVKPLIILSIPWAVSIHTVTAFLYQGLPGRHYWLTAILAPRFLASAFASGPALLILLCMIVRRVTRFDPGRETIQKLGTIVCYAMIVNVFFVFMEFFTAFFSGIPSHAHPLRFLWFGLEHEGVMHAPLVPYMWAAATMGIAGIVLLLFPKLKRHEGWLALACALIFAAAWIDKGVGLIVGGLSVSPLETIAEYRPTAVELAITVGVYAIGALVLTLLYKIAVSVKEETA